MTKFFNSVIPEPTDANLIRVLKREFSHLNRISADIFTDLLATKRLFDKVSLLTCDEEDDGELNGFIGDP